MNFPFFFQRTSVDGVISYVLQAHMVYKSIVKSNDEIHDILKEFQKKSANVLALAVLAGYHAEIDAAKMQLNG